MMDRTLRIALAALALALYAAPAAAQGDIDPETGEVYVPPEQGQETPPDHGGQGGAAPWYAGGPTGTQEEPPPAHGEDPASAGSETGSASGSNAADDHMRAVGRVAVGYMGLTTVPVASFDSAGTAGVGTVSAPALGIRYWLSELVGLDVGLGLGYVGGNVQSGGLTFPTPDAFAMAIHAGAPIALFHAEHYKLLVIPEINFAFATGTWYGADPSNDQSRSGLLFQIGGRIGTELHFGFWGIPQLSVQASVGIYFDYTSVGFGTSAAGTPAVTANLISFATTVQGDPWDAVLGALTALYYFD